MSLAVLQYNREKSLMVMSEVRTKTIVLENFNEFGTGPSL